jgi:hypothetical protein
MDFIAGSGPGFDSLHLHFFAIVLSFWIRLRGGGGVVGVLWAGVNILIFNATRTSLELQALIFIAFEHLRIYSMNMQYLQVQLLVCLSFSACSWQFAF